MRVVVQRVLSAEVVVDCERVGRCEKGLLVLVAAHREDEPKDASLMADRVAGIRIFGDENGKMNLDLSQVNGSVLAVSNFTLYGDAMKSRRPSFTEAASFEKGKELFELFVATLQDRGISVETGIFGANMKVGLVNDGPVTLQLDTRTT